MTGKRVLLCLSSPNDYTTHDINICIPFSYNSFHIYKTFINFGAEAERSYIICDLRLPENVLKMFLNLHDVLCIT